MKYVLVTGASSGIGMALSIHLQESGYHVLAGIRKDADGKKLLELSRSTFPEHTVDMLTPVTIDITNPCSIKAAAARIKTITPEGLHGLVNNAGIAVSGALELVENQRIEEQFSINVVGTFIMIKMFLPLLKRCKGRIVNIGSISGLFSPPGLSVYAASKYAIEGMSDALRVELKPFGVQVSVIEPGKIDTPLWEKAVHSEAIAHQYANNATIADYKELIAFYRNYVDSEKGSPMALVNTAVRDALSNRVSRPRYVIGRAAKIRVLLNYLPARVRDALVYRNIYKNKHNKNRI